MSSECEKHKNCIAVHTYGHNKLTAWNNWRIYDEFHNLILTVKIKDE